MWSETASPGTILYATSKPSGLVAPCPAHGKPDWKLNEAALHKRRRFLKGLHPKCGESAKITDHWPLSSKALTVSATVDVYLPGHSGACSLLVRASRVYHVCCRVCVIGFRARTGGET